MNQYSYDGIVKEFGTIISNRWCGSTYAVSEKKARSNLVYQYKKEHGKTPGTKIALPGKLVMHEGRNPYGRL